MACTASFSMGYPLGGLVEVTCSGGVGTLSTAYGNVTTNCRPSRVRGRINGGSWVMAPVTPMVFGGTYIAAWTLRNVPGATCDNVTDILEVEIEVTDSAGNVSWIPANPVSFSAYCFTMSPPMRFHAQEMFYLKLPKLEPPSFLWGIVASKLAQAEVIKLKRVHGRTKVNSVQAAVWRSIGSAAGLWTLTVGSDKRAQLILRVDATVGGDTYEFELLWGCGKFSPTKGGLFGPVGENPITQVLTVSGTKGQQLQLRAVTAKARAKIKAKAKARPAKRRRARR